MKRTSIKPGWLFACLLAVAASPGLFGAQALCASHVRAQLLADVRSVQPGKPFTVAVRLQMDEGWHTYWKNPGDSGLATKVTWNLPSGVQVGDLQWPFPERIDQGGVVSFGYEKEVLLLAEMTVSEAVKPGTTVTVSAAVEWLECKDLCKPGEATVSMRLPVTRSAPEIDPRRTRQFREARSKLPRLCPDLQIHASYAPPEYVLSLSGSHLGRQDEGRVFFFPNTPGVIDHGVAQAVERLNSGLRVHLKASPYAAKKAEHIRGVLVFATPVCGPGRAVAIDVPVN